MARSSYKPLLPPFLLQPLSLLTTKLTIDEAVAIAAAVLAIGSLLLCLLRAIWQSILRLPCLQSCLLSMEVRHERSVHNYHRYSWTLRQFAICKQNI